MYISQMAHFVVGGGGMGSVLQCFSISLKKKTSKSSVLKRIHQLINLKEAFIYNVKKIFRK